MVAKRIFIVPFGKKMVSLESAEPQLSNATKLFSDRAVPIRFVTVFRFLCIFGFLSFFFAFFLHFFQKKVFLHFQGGSTISPQCCVQWGVAPDHGPSGGKAAMSWLRSYVQHHCPGPLGSSGCFRQSREVVFGSLRKSF